MYSEIITVIQSRASGRFLFKQSNNLWTVPSQQDYDPDVAMAFKAIDDCRALIGDFNKTQEVSINCLTLGKKSILHLWIEKDVEVADDQLGWFSIFDLPSNSDQIINWLLDDERFQESSLSPF